MEWPDPPPPPNPTPPSWGLTQPILRPRTFPVSDPGAFVPVVMSLGGGGAVLIKGTGAAPTPFLRAAAHMQARTQPLAQALPFSLRGALPDAGLRAPVVKMGTRWEGLQRTLREVLSILLCCWCVKELLD